MQKDKMATLQVIGCLLNKPTFLLEDKYKLSIEDFPERFHKIVYGAIETLAKTGVQTFTYITIDDFLSKYDKQYKIFTDNKGAEYIQTCMSMADTCNFDYYYNNVKKFSLLNALEAKGFDIKPVYDNTIVNPDEAIKMQAKFDAYTLDDILNIYDKNLIDLKEQFTSSSVSVGIQAGQGLYELKEQYKLMPEMGMPLSSKKLTTITRGARLKKVYLKTSPSGYGKTRISAGDACQISIPEIYNSVTKSWELTGCNEPVLFITTELEPDEIQSLFASYVSDVNEEKFLDGFYEGDEEARVDKAIDIIKNAPLYIEHVPNFNMDDIERIIKKYKYSKNIGYVFFDYIFTSIKILSEVGRKTGGVKLREDNVLLMFIDRMKSLANELNIHFNTSSQANGDWKNVKDADQNIIRGAKAMADKIDVGYVSLPVTPKDLEAIGHILHTGFSKMPNLVYHIYKIRRGKINHVKLWVYVDLGTCRTYDLFVTDNDYNLLNIEDTNIQAVLKKTEEENLGLPYDDEEEEEEVEEKVQAKGVWF